MKDELKAIWEIQVQFKCPVLGACLTIDEHRKVLKRSKYRTKGLKAHEMHSIIMHNLNDENRLSKRVDRFIKNKYRREINQYGPLNRERFLKAWAHCFQEGNPQGIFLVAATRSGLTNSDLTNIFGDIHMMCHANLHQVTTARNNVARLNEANTQLTKRVKIQKEQIRKLHKEGNELKRKMHKGPKPSCLVNSTSPIKKSSEDNTGKIKITANLEKMSLKNQQTKLSEYKNKINYLMECKNKLENEVYSIQSKNENLTNEIKQLISQMTYAPEAHHCPCVDNTVSDQMWPKKVLMVGGMTKMKQFYRDLIESNGCEFDYHDGYINKGPRNLEARVKRAELILCPVDCNSHGACHKVKNFCKKHNKILKILPSSSLSSISNALTGQSPSLN